MRVDSISIKNFRALRLLPSVTFSQTPVIIGRNDVGKSSMLHALALFFGKRNIAATDFSKNSPQQDTPVEIEVSFCDIDGERVKELEQKRLLSRSGELVLRKSWKTGAREPEVKVIAKDFVDGRFQNLRAKKESELNRLGDECGLNFTRSGRSITNESKIEQLITYARENGIKEDNVPISPDKETVHEIEGLLPDFTLFPSYMTLETDQAQFQNPFAEMIVNQIQINQPLIDEIQNKVRDAISEAIKEIEGNLTAQTDAITTLVPKPEFQWKKLVSLRLETKDQFGITIPLESRGLGVQRLAMVAFLKYAAERSAEKGQHRIFGIEEPETFLHPSAQRDLIGAFKQLKTRGYQIIITSHSPVFAAEAGDEDLILVKREDEGASVIQGEHLSADLIVEELGILPRDQIAGYNACVFVEGPADQVFLETVAKKLKASKRLSEDFSDKKIGVLPVGGNNLKFYVEKELILKRLNRRFGVMIDSHKTAPTVQIDAKILRWKKKCEDEGGKFFILRKRAVENYLHPNAIQRVCGRLVTVDDYNNVKELISTDYDWRKHLKPVVEAMTVEEILEMDAYKDDSGQKHELLEILESLMELVEE